MTDTPPPLAIKRKPVGVRPARSQSNFPDAAGAPVASSALSIQTDLRAEEKKFRDLRITSDEDGLAQPPLPPRRSTTTHTQSSLAASSPATTTASFSPLTPLTPASYGSHDASGFSSAASTPSTATAAAAPKDKEPSFWKTALDETRFFAGGLVSHPHESTKHYTILRHSSGLVLYRGPATSVAVTIFSSPDHPLPRDRTLWLQRRGFSGDTGLRLKTLVGASGSWLDVTPAARTTPDRVAPADERGWQRDIAKFLKKAPKEGRHVAAHRPRETAVVRIPASAADGYFRLVLCAGGGGDVGGGKRKVLCGSPVFRVASTSSDVSIFRGASLRTAPLEAGLKIASVVGNTAVSNFIAPVTGAVQSQIQKYQPGFVETEAGQVAYGATGLQNRFDAIGGEIDQAREMGYAPLGPESEGVIDVPEVVGPDSGPEKPFPISLEGRVVRGTGRSAAETAVPTANLADVSPVDLPLRLKKGVYFGWACILPKKGLTDGLPLDWLEAVIAVGPSPYADPAVVVTNVVTAHLLYDFGPATFFDAKLKVVLMGYLRAMPSSGPAIMQVTERDALVTVSSLSRENWGPETTLDRMRTEKSSRSLSEKYVDARGNMQKQVDRVPLHLVGVRTTGAELRDQAYGHGGLWIAR